MEQYRIPVRARTIELPAGIIGDAPSDAHESSVAAAHRELFEETGYAARRIEAVIRNLFIGWLVVQSLAKLRLRPPD